MQEHLTDEQLIDQLAGRNEAGPREHLAACAACRDEAESLRSVLARYREDYQQVACAARELPEGLWPWQHTAVAAPWAERPAPRRLAWAAAVAIVMLAALLLIEKTPPAQPVAQADADPDHALLVDVERSVRRELPRALEPAALLAQEVSRGTEARSNP
jgi:predicted anti-sigma-YlaC factor YlaD